MSAGNGSTGIFVDVFLRLIFLSGTVVFLWTPKSGFAFAARPPTVTPDKSAAYSESPLTAN